ncbi:hypothetical protein HZC31_00410 [Candidatus Woesearchaeota archaeon]|nr:hypothetical protein [Candidatus Woesearchaeota archaeon]
MFVIVSFEGLGKNVASLISAEAARLGESEEKLQALRGDSERVEHLIHGLEEQLHFLARMEAYMNGKTLNIIGELNRIQGLLTAKEVNLQTAHKNFKMQDRTTSDAEAHKKMEAEMRKTGEMIRRLDAIITEIKAVEKRIVNDAQRDMSTLRMIATEAERGV